MVQGLKCRNRLSPGQVDHVTSFLSAGYVDDGEGSMPLVPAFYSVNEAKKAATHRVYHDNDACPLGRDIPQNERKLGDGKHRLCVDCRRLNNLDNLAAPSSRK